LTASFIPAKDLARTVSRQALFTYRPVPYNELGVALFLLTAVGTLIAAPLAAPAGLFPLGGLCLLPPILIALVLILFRATPTTIFTDGIEVSQPLWRRTLRGPRFFAFSEVKNLFPASYEVTGAFMSPFASSAGTLVHVGLGIETLRGERHVVRFTPGLLKGFRSESEGYQLAVEWLRRIYRDFGRPLVSEAASHSDADVQRMARQAREPLIPLTTIVAAFFLPPTLVALILAVIQGPGLLPPPSLALALAVGGIPPGVAVYLTWKRSRRRNDLLTELAKHREFLRERAATVTTPSPPGAAATSGTLIKG